MKAPRFDRQAAMYDHPSGCHLSTMVGWAFILQYTWIDNNRPTRSPPERISTPPERSFKACILATPADVISKVVRPFATVLIFSKKYMCMYVCMYVSKASLQ